ncbi:unnamed protein product [Paramecium primaurelia]|uniref:Steroid 5-alpha reductase C-terminal domain-containing protein n=1 Tax=Paramecium primaurelia TaxID=5886 RepID=A0A8S1PS06_PARPR|nr:unnamed protein product [Paramecium primaurelia]
MYDFLGGPKPIQIRWIVNLFKALTLPYIVLLMYYMQHFEFGTYLYLSLHGSYGILWIIKDFSFPDQNFQKYTTIPSAIGGCLILIAYWILPLIQVTGFGQNQIKPNLVCFIIILYVFGIILMMSSDCQKYYTLKYKKGLIKDGLFKMNRNPNYTGEILIYLSFAIITNNALSYCIVFMSWIFMFFPFMLRKEISLSQKEGWNEYYKQSYLAIWKFCQSDIINIGLYIIMIVFIIVLIL